MGDTLLEVRGLGRRFEEGGRTRAVLDGLDLDVRHGECVALLGRSGSGKSTLLNLISGIDLPDEGTVALDGVPLTALDERERTLFRRRHIGFVYQFFHLIPTLTVEENVRLPLELNGEPDGGRVSGWLEAVGLGDRLASFPDRLSAGEQQRVAIARALIHKPGLLLADEPTGNLDAETGRRVLALLTGLARREGATLLLATHSKQVAESADRVLTLDRGRLVERGEDLAW
ncbi:ABC transporter ATP-binding protein [Sulfurifustis variabilis]|uniref:ABC transporter ATP-binding protein n=2 Tax=Sulfurifustis variabilis TaxID=1675686 RepID=A0A1B4V4A3_9GAMM|nr:ABC transporter ATP-binding protein [Sulfurifustis variabilis]